jgi:hypothetical protein
LALALRNLTVRELAHSMIPVIVYILLEDLPYLVRDFNLTVRKSFTIPVLVNDKYRYQAMNDTGNPILFKFLNENESFKI